MLGAKLPAAAPALTLLMLLGATAAPTVSPAAPATGQAADTLVGTVRSVEEGAGLEIITGFHLALKVVYLRVGPGTQVEVEGQPAELGDLEPGQVVRVRYEETAEGKLAELIESVRPAPGGRR